ncbi:hypothetical protein CY658_04835 [Variovorax sp. RO1]|uniref:hypothetical protein n=1 Tax=Variovorax sp. RO1 TaxID=2066034 RepID=UPI000C7186BB|nr:hypothetical protein [Variovorax sp. RO1]PLC06362.1 hypothetical protein CY658_04835 [Variovorax sp. RO1]
MGYSTKFSGELRFATEPTAPQLAALNVMFGEDCRDHPEWSAPDLYSIDLELNEDFTGLRWDGMEKTYDLDKLVNVVIDQMRAKWPDFALVGSLQAQGEDVEDRWTLAIGEDGRAHHVDTPATGAIVTCPHCDHRFMLDVASS